MLSFGGVATIVASWAAASRVGGLTLGSSVAGGRGSPARYARRATAGFAAARSGPPYPRPHISAHRLTFRGNNCGREIRWQLALGAIAALLALTPSVASSSRSRTPPSLASYFYGNGLIRAEVVVRDAEGIHDWRLDQG